MMQLRLPLATCHDARCHMPHPRMPLGPPFAFVFPFWQAVINSIAPVLVSFDPNPFGLARALSLSLSRCVCGCTPPSAAPCPPLANTPPTGKLTQRQHLPLLQSGSIFWGAGGRREAGRDWGPDSAAAPAPAPAAAAGLCPLFNPLHASLCTNKAAHFNLAANYERQQQQNYR